MAEEKERKDFFISYVHADRGWAEWIAEQIELAVAEGDITSFAADVVAFKYAQYFYRVDEIVAARLKKAGIPLESLQPSIGSYSLVGTHNTIHAPFALFVGVNDLEDFAYQQIREFSAKVLAILAKELPVARHLAMTIHGVGFGLDEVEATLAQIAGYLDAIQNGQIPTSLERISIVDINADRVARLRSILDENLGTADYALKSEQGYRIVLQKSKSQFRRSSKAPTTIEKAGIESAARRHVFVAMPFKKDLDDVFYYGIQQPVRAAGFLCERVDQEAFLGDILDRVKQKIETASVVIAELTGANPNVYLEVGYAWGKGVPTLLLIKDEQELRFDVRGQRCLKYERIRDLEEALKKELSRIEVSRAYITGLMLR